MYRILILSQLFEHFSPCVKVINTRTDWICGLRSAPPPILKNLKFSISTATFPQSLLSSNTWMFKGAPPGPQDLVSEPEASLARDPGATLAFCPQDGSAARIPCSHSRPVREYPNYMGSKERSRHQVHVNACTCACLWICVLN